MNVSRTTSHHRRRAGLVAAMAGRLTKRIASIAVVVAVLIAAAVPPAHAVLERVGPVDPRHEYPTWYQDKTGLALEFCTPNQAELDGGWCLLLPPDIPGGAPEVPFGNYSPEHFYWNATTPRIDFALPDGGTSTALLVLGLEAAFGNNFPAAGDQVVFGRLRIVIRQLPYSGDYTVYTPFGDFSFTGLVAGDKLFFTSDIGITCGTRFDCALNSLIGPFLLPSAVSGGAEVPPIPLLAPGQDPWYDVLINAGGATPYPGTGKKYIADPGRVGPVTGSTLPPFVSPVDGQTYDHNRFRIEGPNGFVVDEPNFTLAGRIMEGAIPGQVVVNRASYTAAATNKLDVFANGFPSIPSRLPAQAPSPSTTPVLGFFEAPCGGALTIDPATGLVTVNPPPYTEPVGFPEQAMSNSASNFWGQSTPAAIPSAEVFYVCVKDTTARNAAGQIVPAYYLKNVTDEISTTGTTPASYFDGPAGGTLTVRATSSDPAALLILAGFDAPFVNGVASVAGLSAPPATVRVSSSAGGFAELPVITARGGAVLTGVPVAGNDDVPAMFEDCSALPATSCAAPLVIDPLTNDTILVNGAATTIRTAGVPFAVTITQQPRLGAAVLNADGTIAYTPNPNISGTDSIVYTVTVGTQASNQASITIPITPVPDNPRAIGDTTGALRGVSNSVSVLGNDTDPDGAANLAGGSAVIVQGNASLGIVAGTTFPGGIITFTPPASTAAGPYTFTYNAVDADGLVSAAPATVTVNVTTTEAIVPAKFQFTAKQLRWTVSGTDAPAAGQTLTIMYDPATPASYKVNGVCTGNAAGTVLGTATVDQAGNWLLDFILSNSAGVLNPTNTGGNSTGFWCTGPRTLLINSSLSPATARPNIQLK